MSTFSDSSIFYNLLTRRAGNETRGVYQEYRSPMPPRPTTPTMEIFAAILSDRGLQMAPGRLTDALDMQMRFRPALDQMRTAPLSPLSPYIQPETAMRWIENGGALP